MIFPDNSYIMWVKKQTKKLEGKLQCIRLTQSPPPHIFINICGSVWEPE